MIPSVTPKTLEDLASKPKEDTILAKKEEELKGKVLAAYLKPHLALTPVQDVIL